MRVKNCGLSVFLLFYLLGPINAQENDRDIELTGKTITQSFGSYSIPEDWVEITKYSRDGKYFYSHNSESINNDMTNISIEIGSNRYELEDHMTFRYAILRQLLMQSEAIGGTDVSGSGTFTKHDDPLYIFTIHHTDRYGNDGVSTVQFYIIGNKKHILIHLTDFHKENIPNAEEVARFIADSFVWAE
ncbi:MAG: hypothetical protein LBO65_05495 [Spirochaetaceae bacterium]|nr:hypothetical protein [Spirochaetaceae bacterium]